MAVTRPLTGTSAGVVCPLGIGAGPSAVHEAAGAAGSRALNGVSPWGTSRKTFSWNSAIRTACERACGLRSRSSMPRRVRTSWFRRAKYSSSEMRLRANGGMSALSVSASGSAAADAWDDFVPADGELATELFCAKQEAVTTNRNKDCAMTLIQKDIRRVCMVLQAKNLNLMAIPLDKMQSC